MTLSANQLYRAKNPQHPKQLKYEFNRDSLESQINADKSHRHTEKFNRHIFKTNGFRFLKNHFSDHSSGELPHQQQNPTKKPAKQFRWFELPLTAALMLVKHVIKGDHQLLFVTFLQPLLDRIRKDVGRLVIGRQNLSANGDRTKETPFPVP